MQHLRDLKQETSSFVGILVFYEQLKFRAQLSWACKKFYNLKAWTATGTWVIL